MRSTAAKELEAVLQLDGPARHRHFVKRVADSGIAWGLWQDGWALMRDDDGSSVFPLWPAQEYADACRVDEWAAYEPREIDLDDLLDQLLPRLVEQDTQPGVFPTPGGQGVMPGAETLARALRTECLRYA